MTLVLLELHAGSIIWLYKSKKRGGLIELSCNRIHIPDLALLAAGEILTGAAKWRDAKKG